MKHALCALVATGLLLTAGMRPLAGAQFAAPSSRLNTQWIAFTRAGSANSNLQCFNPANVTVTTSYLVLTAIQQTRNCWSIDLTSASYSYTSGFVSMRSYNFLYGSVEFRAKFGPCGGASCGGVGYWPAVWMNSANCQASDPTGTDNNCDEQEIDIAEICICNGISGNFLGVNQGIHTNCTPGCAHNDYVSATVTDASTNFHVYTMVWTAGSIVFYVDGVSTGSIVQAYVPSAAMYVKVDQYIGSTGGTVNNATFPWLAQIDYLKVGAGCSGVNPLSGCSSMPFDDEFN